MCCFAGSSRRCRRSCQTDRPHWQHYTVPTRHSDRLNLPEPLYINQHISIKDMVEGICSNELSLPLTRFTSFTFPFPFFSFFLTLSFPALKRRPLKSSSRVNYYYYDYLIPHLLLLSMKKLSRHWQSPDRHWAAGSAQTSLLSQLCPSSSSATTTTTSRYYYKPHY